MHRLVLSAGMVVGTSTPNCWSQVQVVPIMGGQLILLLSLHYTGDGELVDLTEIGGNILENLRVRGALESADVSTAPELIVSAIVVRRDENQLTISGRGSGEVYLDRGGKLAKIYSGSPEIATHIGLIQVGDTIALMTQELAELLGVLQITQVLSGGTSLIDNLAVTVHGQDDSSPLAAVVAEVRTLSDTDASAPSQRNYLSIHANWFNRLKNVGTSLRVKKPLLIDQPKRTWNLWIGLSLLLLLLVAVGYGVVRRAQYVKVSAYTTLEASVTQKISEARSIGDLNPDRATLLLQQANQELSEYIGRVEDLGYRAKATVIASELAQVENEIFRKQAVEVSTLVDLPVLKSGLVARSMSVDPNGNLLLADQSSPRIVGMNISDKSNFTIETPDIGVASEVAASDKKVYAITDKGIGEMAMSGGGKITIEPDDLWGNISQIAYFAGNIYLLDTGQSEIWKYPGLTDGFGTRRRWLGAGIQLDLTKVIDIKVEGDIWILTSTGKLERYSGGVPQEFAMEGYPASEPGRIANPSSLFVTDEKVYVLENGAKRVVVFDIASGRYESQYANDALGDGKDLVVYEGKGYVLVGDKIVWFQF